MPSASLKRAVQTACYPGVPGHLLACQNLAAACGEVSALTACADVATGCSSRAGCGLFFHQADSYCHESKGPQRRLRFLAALFFSAFRHNFPCFQPGQHGRTGPCRRGINAFNRLRFLAKGITIFIGLIPDTHGKCVTFNEGAARASVYAAH